MFALPLLIGLVTASLDPDGLPNDSQIDSLTPTGNPATTRAKRVQFTGKQIAIIVVSAGLTVVLIVAEGLLTFFCRLRRRRRIPTDLEEVMLPAPDDAYGEDQL
jgi:hypothetical protein